MGLRTIVSLPDPVLRRKARPVIRFDANLQNLIEGMIVSMRVAPGVGLAAPQVNVSQRLIVVEYAEHEDDEDTEEKPAKKKLYVMLNPEIIKAFSR